MRTPKPDLFRCGRCGSFGHQTLLCRATLGLPLETPPHNGVYRGNARVQYVPPGVMGEDLRLTDSDARRKMLRGHLVQSRYARMAALSGGRKSKLRALDKPRNR